MRPPYADDLAYIHDVGHTDFIRQAAPELLRLLRRASIRTGRVLDLGCGAGQWAETLTAAGYQVTGVDISPAMIRRARRRVPAARFIRGSFLRMELPRCDAITSLGECFNYLFDGDGGTTRLRTLFSSIRAALRPGGVLIFDIAEPGRGRTGGPPLRHREGDDWAVLVRVTEDRRHLLTREITTFRRVGRNFRRRRELHRLRLYRASDLAAMLRSLGFTVRIVRGYGRFRFPPCYAGIIARVPLLLSRAHGRHCS